MLRITKLGPAVLCIALALPAFASPFGPPVPRKMGKHHGHGKTIPARHNAGRPMHG